MLLKIIFTSLILGIAIVCSAQRKAITETGEEVLLYDDGTWKSISGEDTEEKTVKVNPASFTKSDRSTFLLKSTKFNVGFWIDPKKWKFEKASNNEDAEYELHLKGGDLFAMVIAEKMEIPLETLKKIAIENGRNAAPDLVILDEEYRTVNGLKVLQIQMQGTMQGIKFFYYGYYFSNPTGTVQFVTYSAQNLMDQYRPEIENLLNGLVEL